MKFVAEHGYTYMSVYAPTSVVRRWFDGYRQAADELQIEADPEKIVFSVPIYVAATDEAAHREGRRHVEWLFHRGLKQSFAQVYPPGYMSPGSMRGLLMSGMKPYTETSYEELLEGGYAVVGSPDSVAARLHQLQQQLGFGQLNGLFSIGDISHEETKRSMELFSSKVMPALRPLGTARNTVAGS
jgi:alkanesulfonate monooxygenase SsuD/methylene tetrahydromethanopterin reductase-like flavin-dependent oxidoreductase (luciferase family)